MRLQKLRFQGLSELRVSARVDSGLRESDINNSDHTAIIGSSTSGSKNKQVEEYEQLHSCVLRVRCVAIH